MLRLLWACLRWDDMAVKPSAGSGTTRTGTPHLEASHSSPRRVLSPWQEEECVCKIIICLFFRDCASSFLPCYMPEFLFFFFKTSCCDFNSRLVLLYLWLFGKDGILCILLWVLLFCMLFGLSSSSPHQSSPIPTHYDRDLGNWNHHHRDHQAPGRGALRNSFRVLHPENHLPPWSAWDSERLVKVILFILAVKDTI